MRTFGTFLWRITAAHVVTYFLAGLMAFYVLNYGDMFEKAPYSYFMKPASSPAVAAGPLLQVIRGLIFLLRFGPSGIFF